MTDSCAGACCSVFPLPGYSKMASGQTVDPEAPMIVAMVIPLEDDEAIERYARLGYGTLPPDYFADGLGLYTCRNWNEETRLCGIYDTRPVMCRDYPYGLPCERGCGFCSSPEVAAKWDEIRAR